MSHFKPLRASPLLSPTKKSRTKTPKPSRFDVTTSSATSISSEALSGLTAEDVQLIDEIIRRAPATTTTFLNVFKAYNEVLQERGLDSGNDVVYYKMLLKIGVVRGMDWGTKWDTVKEQYGYVSGPPKVDHTPRQRTATKDTPDSAFVKPRRTATRPTPIAKRLNKHHSVDDDATDSDRTSSPRTLVQRPTLKDFISRAPKRDNTQSELPIPSIAEFIPVRSRPTYMEQSQASTSVISFETAPTFRTPNPLRTRPSVESLQDSQSKGPLSRLKRLGPKSGSAPVENKPVDLREDDAWKKVEMDMDEKYADDVRRMRLMEQSFNKWKGSLSRSRIRLDTADDARRLALLKTNFTRWCVLAQKARQSERRLVHLADLYTTKRVLLFWRRKLSQKRAQEWKTEMKEKLRYFRRCQDKRIIREAIVAWRQQYLTRFAGQFYEHNLCRRMVMMWCLRLNSVKQLELHAQNFVDQSDQLRLRSCLQQWRAQLDLRARERLLQKRVETRIKTDFLEKWAIVLHNVYKGEEFYDRVVLRRFFSRWKQSHTRIQGMAMRADKQKRRGDKLLVRALFHIWMAKERGNLLLNVTNNRILQATFAVWRQRTLELDAMTLRAERFASRPSSTLLTSALEQWHRTWMDRRKVHLAAELYDKQRYLTYWRIKLREKLELVRRAKFARKYLLLCNAWRAWIQKLDEQRRMSKLQMVETKLLSKHLTKWQQIAARERRHREAIQNFVLASNARLVKKALDTWTSRVIDIKDRELECTEARQHMALAKHFNKWRNTWRVISARNSENVSLMQSYQDIRREETLRRMFNRWQTAFKKSRYLRMRLQEYELQKVADAWDRWQERLQAERLKPLEYGLMVHLDTNRLFRAFVLWHSKTKSTTAVRFYASNVKAEYWNIWRNAMPKVLQARKAREKADKALLARVLDKWVKAYRTKIALKAVARARFLRLPSGLPRQQTSLGNSMASVTTPIPIPNTVGLLRTRERPSTSVSDRLREDRIARAGGRASRYDSDDDRAESVRETTSVLSSTLAESNVWAQLRRARMGLKRN